MASTAKLTKEIYPYVLKRVSKIVGKEIREEKLNIGINNREKKFNGVSEDGEIILNISTSSGYSRTGKLPVGKLNTIYANCYLMNLTDAKRKILVFTNEEFFQIVNEKLKDFLIGFELMYIELPEELKEVVRKITVSASKEISI